jgi:hypothetical protein
VGAWVGSRAAAGDHAGPEAVFAVVRQRLRELNWRQLRVPELSASLRRADVVVLASHGGWLRSGEAGDADGLTPLGDLIDRLLGTMRAAALSPAGMTVLVAWYGLERVPVGP